MITNPSLFSIMKQFRFIMKKYFPYIIFFLAIVGLIDAAYLTWEHYSGFIPPCLAHSVFNDCGQVLTSKYSVMFGVSVALIGVAFYATEAICIFLSVTQKNRLAKKGLLIATFGGFIGSVYFVYLMLVIIKAICLYCFLSAIISFTIFILSNIVYPIERKKLIAWASEQFYLYVAKPIFFQIDPETVHVGMVNFGEIMGKIAPIKSFMSFSLEVKVEKLAQKINGINFLSPVGLAAGFDYEGRLTQILSSISFGFQTVGTITNMPYEGNKRPMLGRLPKSKSLLVNKGFKNFGAQVTANKLNKLIFPIPVGISIGRTNSPKLTSQKQSIEDIVKAFEIFEKSGINNSYYELNISCPNLSGDISFYPPNNLEELLKEIDKLKLKKPTFVKMPIGKTDAEFLSMLKKIDKHSPIGVIIGNLQTDRKHKTLDQTEVKQFTKGYFSGKPTYERSNELIKLAYKNYRKRFTIIGCGGIFSASDAYTKIKLGASLVQLITGMIYQGPQLISQINLGLLDLLEKDGFKNIKEVVGKEN